MDFTKSLLTFLQRQGYAPASDHQPLMWAKEYEDRLYLIGIVPEHLPGQREIPVADVEAVLQKKASELMVMRSKYVETMVLMVFRGTPLDRIINEINAYDNIWCPDISTGRLLIYENQKTGFGPAADAFHDRLEDFLRAFVNASEIQEKKEFRRVFTPLNTLLIILNVLVFVILTIMGDTEDAGFMAEHGALTYFDVIAQGKFYLLVTSMFLHFGILHLVENMIMLTVTGSLLERMTGKTRYGIIYLTAGIGSSIFSFIFTLSSSPSTVSAGASGAIFGVMGGLLFLVLKDLITKKRTIVNELGMPGIIFMIVIALAYGFLSTGVDNAAHIGGLICGFIITGILSISRQK